MSLAKKLAYLYHGKWRDEHFVMISYLMLKDFIKSRFNNGHDLVTEQWQLSDFFISEFNLFFALLY